MQPLPFHYVGDICMQQYENKRSNCCKWVNTDLLLNWSMKSLFPRLAIAVLRDKEPGCFLIRDSNSFQGAYGLALKVSTAPAHTNTHTEPGSTQEQLVRHFLIESGAKGVKIKGCQNETYFGEINNIIPGLSTLFLHATTAFLIMVYISG